MNKTRRKFLPNLQQVSLPSETLGRSLRLRVTASAVRSVEHVGGIDKFLLKARDNVLSQRAIKFKKEISAKIA